jgi:hypothetical protein
MRCKACNNILESKDFLIDKLGELCVKCVIWVEDDVKLKKDWDDDK